MIIVLSPAKTLDFVTPVRAGDSTQPDFLAESQLLVNRLRKFSPAQLARLLQISDALAAVNAGRYADWAMPFRPDNARPALYAFNGDVYQGLAAATLKAPAVHYAQGHLRILSGLYGLLRPLDLIQPYRLEMGTRLPNPHGEDLYAFWGERIIDALNAALYEAGARTLVNLASHEYFKVIPAGKLAVPVIEPVFEDWSAGRYKVLSFYAKRARGLMARHALVKRLKSAEGLKEFAAEGYAYVDEASTPARWVFRRRLAQRQ
jgi:cytoplasmic iron level regulating protein YaaA (DUF328/UPF0246 family)